MPSTGCTVRPMLLSDLPFVSAVIREDARHGHYHAIYAIDDDHLANLMAVVGQGLRDGRAILTGVGQSHAVFGLTLACDHQLAGFALFTTREPEKIWTELWMMSIDPARRHRGLGKALLDGALARSPIDRAPLLARCNPPSSDMMNLLRHRGFQMLGAGPEGTHVLGRNLPAPLRAVFQWAMTG